MKKTGKSFLLLGVLLLMFAATGYAFPMAGDSITITAGDNRPGNFAGGEFKLTTLDYELISFCVEWNEHIYFGGTYQVQSVADYAANGGTGGATSFVNGEYRDPLSNSTKWLMNEYINGPLKSMYAIDSDSLAGAMQVAIWRLEQESYFSDYDTRFGDVADTLIALANQLGGDYRWDNVRVVNLMKGDTYAQSQIVAAPVPEPATMLLLGTGLVGLAGLGRRKIRKTAS